MAVIAHVVIRDVTPEQYDAVRAAAGWLEDTPAGGLGHLTWFEGNDCHNVDAWESEQAFGAFGEQRLGPAMAKAGVDRQPEVTFHEAHEVFTPIAGTITATPATAATTDNVSIVRSGYAAFGRGDIPGVLALFDDNIRWYTPDSVHLGGTYEGPQGVLTFFSRLGENAAELHVEPESYVDRGDTVVAIGAHRGTTVSGNPIAIPWVHVWTLSGGKAIAFTEFFDTAKMNAALGDATIDVRSTEGATTA